MTILSESALHVITLYSVILINFILFVLFLFLLLLADSNFVAVSKHGQVKFFKIPPFELEKTENLNTNVYGLDYINGNLYFFTTNNQNQTVLAVVTSNALLTAQIPFTPISGIIEVSGVIVAYGSNNASLIQIQGNEMKVSTTQQLSQINNNIVNSMVYYPPQTLFISAHENGDLGAWKPGNAGLESIGNINICKSVSYLH